jgi:hypothetical protein
MGTRLMPASRLTTNLPTADASCGRSVTAIYRSVPQFEHANGGG